MLTTIGFTIGTYKPHASESVFFLAKTEENFNIEQITIKYYFCQISQSILSWCQASFLVTIWINACQLDLSLVLIHRSSKNILGGS